MRHWTVVVLLLAAACQEQPKPPHTPLETTFDGAQVTDAAATIAHGERIGLAAFGGGASFAAAIAIKS